MIVLFDIETNRFRKEYVSKIKRVYSYNEFMKKYNTIEGTEYIHLCLENNGICFETDTSVIINMNYNNLLEYGHYIVYRNLIIPILRKYTIKNLIEC